MKTWRLIFLLSSGYCGAYAQPAGDSIATPKNVVKISPLSLLVGDGSLFYERVLSQRASLVGGVGFGWDSFFYSKTPSPGRFHYERLTVEYRQYLTHQHPAPMGVYVGLYSRFARLTLEDYLFDQQGNFVKDQYGQFVKPSQQVYVLIPGAMVGVQVGLKRVVIDLFFGLQYQLPTSKPLLRSVTPELMSKQGLAPRYGLTVGYSF